MKILKSGGDIYNLSESLILYRKHEASITLTQSDSQEEIARRVIQKYLKEILNFNATIAEVTLMRRALRENLTDFSLAHKFTLIKYLHQFYKHFSAKYPEVEAKNHARYMCFYTIDRFIFNKYLKNIAKGLIRGFR
ncbi:MAG: hypothetical protein EPO11_01865 [Gammaproteobacteria bacterium]|nr:MAG: hypothetical protein EPO11_01865 [Gammaproteobacteria bacterium]